MSHWSTIIGIPCVFYLVSFLILPGSHTCLALVLWQLRAAQVECTHGPSAGQPGISSLHTVSGVQEVSTALQQSAGCSPLPAQLLWSGSWLPCMSALTGEGAALHQCQETVETSIVCTPCLSSGISHFPKQTLPFIGG